MATKIDILRTHLKAWMGCRKNRKARSEMTKAVALVTGMHPKSVPRAFRREQMRGSGSAKRRGRPAKYGPDVTAALKDVWEAANGPCGEILRPAIAEYVAVLRRDGMWAHGEAATAGLLAMGEHTVRRRAADLRLKHAVSRGLGSTKPSALKTIIPIFKGPWKDLPPGNGQVDTVAHCGGSLAGDFIYTLNYTDFATYWIVPVAQWNKGQRATVESMARILALLPFAWLMAHPDTGSEFINWLAKAWFESVGVRLTRSEPGKKNDNMCVEERNGHVVRKYLGYLRYDAPEAVAKLNELYAELALYLNHFIPVRRTLSKERVGAKWRRTYEKAALTPCQRVLAHAAVPEAVKARLRAEHESLNPLVLKRKIDKLTGEVYSLQKANRTTEPAGKPQ